MSSSKWIARGWIDGLSKHEGVIAILTMIHLFVGLAQGASLFNALIQKNITQHSFLNHFRIARLKLTHTSIHDNLLLRWHIRQDILFDTSQQERPQNFMQLGHGLILPLLQKNILLGCGTLPLLTNVFESEPRLEDGQIIKDGWVDKVEQTPQFLKRDG